MAFDHCYGTLHRYCIVCTKIPGDTRFPSFYIYDVNRCRVDRIIWTFYNYYLVSITVVFFHGHVYSFPTYGPCNTLFSP